MIRKLLHKISKILEVLSVVCFVILFLLVLLQMLGRYTRINGLGWTDEMISCFTTWMAMLGASYLAERQWHVQVTMFLDGIKGFANKLLHILIEIVNLACGLAVAYSGQLWLKSSAGKITAILQIQYNIWYVSILAFGFFFALFSLFHLTQTIFDLFDKETLLNNPDTE